MFQSNENDISPINDIDQDFFTLGVYASDMVAELYDYDISFKDFYDESVCRFFKCDWGNVSASEKEANDTCVLNNCGEIFSKYIDDAGRTIMIIHSFEADRTSVVFPDEV